MLGRMAGPNITAIAGMVGGSADDGWLGLLREKEDIGKRKGRAAGPTTDTAQGALSSSHLEPLSPPTATFSHQLRLI
ncbi:unnamed protein product [Pleuronectes platessa]|uniref:Uncharacterized protein n=1 Tax=Pleuronectes platessa TaxID=8262 RepID=A0A9N7U525_PLEPL|nr:unnamed protein product [Pleuronectes platessa]